MKEGSIHIGTSGWNYDHWKGNFYPDDLPQKEWLTFYTKQFKTVELNSSFYHLPKEKTYENWYNNTPDDFVFSVKASRYITHIQKLKDTKDSLKKFFDGAVLLKEKLGSVLFQLPPNLNFDKERIENFCRQLPENLKCTFEFRESGWWNEETYQILSKYNIAFCFFELGGKIPPHIVTSNLIYVRLHGPGSRYKGSYPDDKLKKWSDDFSVWHKEGREIYCYFDNDEKGYAPQNALTLLRMLKD